MCTDTAERKKERKEEKKYLNTPFEFPCLLQVLVYPLSPIGQIALLRRPRNPIKLRPNYAVVITTAYQMTFLASII